MTTRLRKWGNWFLVVLLFGSSFLSTPSLAADTKVLVVNEVCPNPNEGVEWIELFNLDDEDLVLAGYSISDQTGQRYPLDKYSIAGNGFLLLEQDKDFKFVINNDSDEIRLYQAETLIDKVTYGGETNAPVPKKGESIGRVPDGNDSDADNLDFRVVNPTPGESYEKKVYSDLVTISELFISPSNGVANEFIEIINKDNEAIDLAGWKIDDIVDGGSNPYVIPTLKIEPDQYLVFSNIETGISLNDSGDQVNLINPANEIVNSVTYVNAPKDRSYSEFVDGWFWAQPTPGTENILDSVVDQPLITVDEAVELDDGESAFVRGTVSVLPGVLSGQYLYIQEGNRGIQIYSYEKSFPELVLGDLVEIRGKLSTVAGERRIKIVDKTAITVVGQNCCIAPLEVDIGDLSSGLVGVLVSVRGRVVQKSTASFDIMQGGSELKVLLRDGSGLKASLVKRDDEVEIFGILSIYNGSLRLLPTSQNDVRIILQGNELPRVGGDSYLWLYWFILGLFIYLVSVLWIIYREVKKIRLQLQRRLQGRWLLEIFLHWSEI